LRQPYLALAAAALALAVLSLALTNSGMDVHAVVASADGPLYRLEDGKRTLLGEGERIEAGQAVQAQGAGVLALVEGSRIETRMSSELLLDRADDGIRIRLNEGSIIVNAAKQSTGHLYVQTKDLIVSVVGTVFLVNAEKEGSRVAVIEGEVRVQQGPTERQLRPGEQVTTNPDMKPLPVKEEISWSRNAETHMALLEQAAGTPPGATPQNAAEERVTFEVASIRPSAPRQLPGGRGAAGGAPAEGVLPPGLDQARSRAMACRGTVQVDPGRFVITNTTVYRLIVTAYGLKNCALVMQLGLISGGPEWVKSDQFDVVAKIPEGSPVYTRQQLIDGDAPRLQLMIQTLLAERFRLTLQREMKDIPASNLLVGEPGKIRLSENQTPPAALVPGQGVRAGALPRGVMLNCAGIAIPISSFANCLQTSVGRPIIDRTNLKGLFDIPSVPNANAPAPLDQAYHASQLLEQVGLKLEATMAAMEVLNIERVEPPTEN
jgi:uncharacterized protein (TIGR03435 family)